MTKASALDSFFNSFGIPAFPSNRVPDDVMFPYLTYEQTSHNYGNATHPRVNLWYRSDSEVPINAKADEISKAIALGKSIPCDDGAIYAYLEEGWQVLTDEADSMISGRTTNLTLRFNTL